MSHRRRLIIAPDSPPATPPTESGAWAAHGRHHHAQYQPGRPRAVVQRSRFSIQNPSPVTSRSGRHSSRHSGSPHTPQQQRPAQPSSSSTRTPGVFKFDEEMNGSFNLPRSSHQPSQRRHLGKLHGLRRSESMDSFTEEVDHFHGRISESEPPKDSPILTKMMSTSQPHTSSSASRRTSLDMPRPTSRRDQFTASAPIKIPSRSKQMEERKRRAAAAEKAKAAAAANNSHSSRHYRPRRTVPTTPKYSPDYKSSSDDSMDDIPRKRR